MLPHFADVETEAQRGARCWTCVISLSPHGRKQSTYSPRRARPLRDVKPLSWSAAAGQSRGLLPGLLAPERVSLPP